MLCASKLAAGGYILEDAGGYEYYLSESQLNGGRAGAGSRRKGERWQIDAFTG